MYDHEDNDEQLYRKRIETSARLQKKLFERRLTVDERKSQGEVTGEVLAEITGGKNCMIAVAGMSAKANADALLQLRNLARTCVGKHRVFASEL